MEITKLTLENIGPYYKEVVVRPQVEAEKPIILFRGENDTGKTSLYTAIRFCLYGAESRSQRNSLINRTAAVEGDGTSRVQIDFDHNGETYIIERLIHFDQVEDETERQATDWERSVKTPSDVIVSADDDGEEYNSFINRIIPESVADYFFFDAEELQRFEEAHDEEVKKAIETVLGIREIENAISDLDDRERKYERELSQIESTVAQVNEHREELREVISELDTLTGAADEKGEIEEFEEKVETKRQNLTEVQESLARAKDADDLRDELATVEENLEEARGRLQEKEEARDEIRKRAGPLIATRAAQVIESDFESKGLKGETAVISRVLEEGECICGEKITTRGDHRQHLRERLMMLTSAENEELMELNSLADELDIDVSGQLDRYQELQTDIRSISKQISQLEERRTKLNNEINEIERQFSEELKKKEATLESDIRELKSEIDSKRERVGELKNRRKQLRERIDSQEQATEREERLQNLANLAERCKNAMESLKDEFVESRRAEVEKHASETFLELTNRPDYYDGLRITDNYELRVVVDDAEREIEEQKPSAGQRQIIAYAFIAGLSRYTPRDAPVIIDTPIGRLDPTHKQNLINHYHEFSNQVIILYQPNELSENDLEKMRGWVSQHYHIKIRDDTDAASTIEPFEAAQLVTEDA
jgi:DNA sulfur modification protein DndD